jgi:hypothetical protein
MELTANQRARIDKGAELLDAKRPEWFTAVRTSILDIDSFSLCVVCQTMGRDFWSGCEALGLLDHKPEGGDFLSASEHGFYPHADDRTEDAEVADELAKAKNAYWRELIVHRLENLE